MYKVRTVCTKELKAIHQETPRGLELAIAEAIMRAGDKHEGYEVVNEEGVVLWEEKHERAL
jgi:hypothetical protein